MTPAHAKAPTARPTSRSRHVLATLAVLAGLWFGTTAPAVSPVSPPAPVAAAVATAATADGAPTTDAPPAQPGAVPPLDRNPR